MAHRVDCKKGLHQYSSPHQIGGGIARRICLECALVQIDITDRTASGDTDLFTEPKLATMFKVEALLARVTEEIAGHSFGEVPANRRRPARAFG